MAIKNTAIPDSADTSIYTSTDSNAITTIIVCNTNTTPTTGDRTLTLYAVANNAGAVGTPAAGNMIVQTLTIPAGDTVSFDQEKMVLVDNDAIFAFANGTGLTATVSTLPV
jgi:hypothetical protein